MGDLLSIYRAAGAEPREGCLRGAAEANGLPFPSVPCVIDRLGGWRAFRSNSAPARSPARPSQPVAVTSPADAPTADPLHYKVEFENADVRVLRINYPARSTGNMHTHPHSVTVFLTDGHIRMTMPDGRARVGNIPQVAAVFEEAGPHRPENIADTDFEAIRIELKK